MNEQAANTKMVGKLLFRLLPVQILLSAVGAVNGIVSSYFAANYVGVEAMSAVGLYSPLNMLISSVSIILVGGFRRPGEEHRDPDGFPDGEGRAVSEHPGAERADDADQ